MIKSIIMSGMTAQDIASGYEVELTARTCDGGYDLVAVRKAELDARISRECKRYNAEQRLGVGLVRNLYGVKQHERATKAILATTATFAKDATVFAEVHKWELELRDYRGVLDWLKQARRSRVI